jgi:hypothetical protein
VASRGSCYCELEQKEKKLEEGGTNGKQDTLYAGGIKESFVLLVGGILYLSALIGFLLGFSKAHSD